MFWWSEMTQWGHELSPVSVNFIMFLSVFWFGTCSASPGWGWCICSALPLSCACVRTAAARCSPAETRRTRARPSPSEPPASSPPAATSRASFPSRCGSGSRSKSWRRSWNPFPSRCASASLFPMPFSRGARLSLCSIQRVSVGNRRHTLLPVQPGNYKHIWTRISRPWQRRVRDAQPNADSPNLKSLSLSLSRVGICIICIDCNTIVNSVRRQILHPRKMLFLIQNKHKVRTIRY